MITTCSVCHHPKAIYSRVQPNGTVIYYGKCNRHGCKMERKARKIIEEADKQSKIEAAANEPAVAQDGPLSPEPPKPREPQMPPSPSWLARRDYWRVFPRRIYRRAAQP
jgi:hypothetical protein